MQQTAIEKQIYLKERWTHFRTENPKTRIRDAAKQLGVSEAELLATDCGKTVTKLTDNFPELLQEFHTLGRIMALTNLLECNGELSSREMEINIFCNG